MTTTASRLALLITLAALAGAAIACNLPGQNQPTPTADAGGVEVTATPSEAGGTPVVLTAEPTAGEPTSTPPTGAVGADGLADCVPASADIPTTEPAYADLTDRAVDWLNAGIAPDAIEETLRGLGWIDVVDPPIGGLYPLDADGDGVRDIAMLTFNPEAVDSVFGPAGDAVLYACVEGWYQVAGRFVSAEAEEQLFELKIADITGDEADDLLFVTQFCGAHTCYYTLYPDHYTERALRPLPWDEGFETAVSWPYSENMLEDTDGDGDAEIVVDTGMIGSVGAGPQRTFRIIYDWEAEALIEASREVTSTEHMIHVVNDADDRFDTGDYGGALALYQRALDDPELDRNPEFPYTGWADDLAGYVEMKKMLAYLAINAGPEALDQYNLIQLRYDNTVYSGYAYLFWNAYQQANSIPQGCEAILDQARADADAAGVPLNQYGYANRYYEVEDMCPF